MKKRLIFVLKDSGGFYEDIFHEKLDYEELLLSFYVYDWIKEKIRHFIKAYGSLSEQRQRELELRRAFLPHSDTQLTAMFGKVMDFKYPQGCEARKVYETLLNNQNFLEKIYEKLVGILEIVIKQRKSVEGEKFNPRNFLVNADTYEIIEDNLKLQFDAIKAILEILQ